MSRAGRKIQIKKVFQTCSDVFFRACAAVKNRIKQPDAVLVRSLANTTQRAHKDFKKTNMPLMQPSVCYSTLALSVFLFCFFHYRAQ